MTITSATINKMKKRVNFAKVNTIYKQLRWPSGMERLSLERFDSESGQTIDFKIGIHSFPA